MNPLSRAFSASCLSVDDYDYTMPRGKPVKHVLGSGEDLFDENGRPFQPQPKTMTKIFSGSALDLDNNDPSDSDSHQVSPAAAPHDRTQQSFNDYLDQRQRSRHDLGASAQSKTMVLVVGGAGYLASHIIEQLLREGYEVRATLPDMRDSPKLRDLCSMVPESKHMLSVVEANIINSASMRSAMLGCRYVIHCGVPQLPQGADAVEYHRQAVLALFDAARETGGARVERIVLTGSHTNVLSSTKSRAPTESGMYDETQWNGIATRASDPLSFARVSFEKEAVRLRDIQGGSFELTVVLPAIMIGPTRTQEVSEAMRNIMEFSTASPHFPIAPNVYWNFVDVRDVASAHVKAMTSPNANGQRYIVTHTVLNLAGLGRQIRAHFPHLTPPVYTAPFLLSIVAGPWLSRASLRYLWSTLGVRRVLDGRRACNELDLTLTPMADTIRDAIDSLIEQGHLPPNDGTVATSGAVVMARYAAGFSVLAAGVSAAIIVLRRRSH